MADTDLLIEELSTYLKPKDVEHVRVAIEFSRAAHQGQMRQSGDPYISHPIAVARILTPLHIDAQAIIAALLHDVVEDTDTTTEQVAEKFGKPVAELVDGLSKLDKIQFETREDAQAEIDLIKSRDEFKLLTLTPVRVDIIVEQPAPPDKTTAKQPPQAGAASQAGK